jgi:hypothetical protein
MSKREAVLCDVTDPKWVTTDAGRGKGCEVPIACDNLSIDTCVLCGRDYCADHALHPKRGLILRAESLTIESVAGSVPMERAYGTDSNGRVPAAPFCRIGICRPCRDALSDSLIRAALDETAKHFTGLIAAALAAKALSK